MTRRVVDVLGTALLATLYAAYSVQRHATFVTGGYDLGIFDQALRHVSRGKPPLSPVKGVGFDLLGDHFHPLLGVLAPLYWWWDDPRVLLVAQAVIVAAAAPVLVRIVQRRLDPTVARVLVALVMVSWPIQGLIDFDVHEVCLAVPLLCLAFDALDTRAAGRFLCWCALLLGVREDMGLVVGLLGAVWLVETRHCGRRGLLPGVAALVLGPVAMVVVTTVVIPAHSSSGFAYWNFGGLADTPRDLVVTVLTHPLRALGLLVDDPAKRLTLALLTAPLAGAFLASPRFLVCLPLVVERFWASRTTLWRPQFHYNSAVFVILVIAAVDALGRVSARWLRVGGRVITATLAVTVVVAPVVSAASSPFILVPGRVGELDSPRVQALRRAVSLVPAQTCVVADNRVVPHLTVTNRATVPGTPSPRADYVVLDLGRDETGNSLGSPGAALGSYLGQGYRMVLDESGVVVLKRPGASQDATRCGPLAP